MKFRLFLIYSDFWILVSEYFFTLITVFTVSNRNVFTAG